MYSIVKAVCLTRTTGAQRTVVDLSEMIVSSIYNTYSEVYLELSNSYLTKNIYVDFISLKSTYSSSKLLLKELIESFGNVELPTIESIPSTEIKYARYSDSLRAGYKVDLAKIGYEVNRYGSRDTCRDLVITRPDYSTNLSLLHSHCLVTVNGFVHYTDADSVKNKAFVYDGGHTNQVSGMAHLGILSFLDIGSLEKIKFNTSDFYTVPNMKYSERMYIKTKDLTNKTPILVLGGYLIFLQKGVFWKTSDNSLAINLDRIPLLERYYESKHFIDLSSLGLTTSTSNKDEINVEEFYSNSTIEKMFLLSQSFLVLVDIENINTETTALKYNAGPGRFVSYKDITSPIVAGYGRMPEYIKTPDNGRYAINFEDTYFKHFNFQYSPIQLENNVTSQLTPDRQCEYNKASELLIYAYK